jgi:predicted nuclease with TOPRIM domain
MSPAIWNPNIILQVDEGSRLGMCCVGLERSNYNSRCRLVLPEDRYNAICHLLDAISMKLPHDVTMSKLRQLARLGLCQYHGYQVNEIVAKWVDVLDCIEDVYRTYKQRSERSTRDLNSCVKVMNECRGLLGVEEDCNDALSLVLRRHVNKNARLKKELLDSRATCARLQKNRAEVKDQKDEICRLSAENSRLSTLLREAEEEQERCKNQESNLTAECEKLRKENAELQDNINSKKDKYKDLHDREQSATMKLMATTTQLHEVRSVNQGLDNDKKTLQSELNILKQEMKILNDKNSSISSELASAAASLSAAHKENMQLRVQLTTSTTEIMELRNRVDYLSTPVWYQLIQWIKQKVSGLTHLVKPGKEVPDEEERVALAPAVSIRDAWLA